MYCLIYAILQDDKENPSIAILAGVTKGWLGITHLRRLQIRAHVRGSRELCRLSSLYMSGSPV